MSLDINRVRALEKIVKLKIIDLSRQKIVSIRSVNTEWGDLRDYVLGDDVRFIDWKASARKGKLMVRERIEERKHYILIMLDVSESMKMGSRISKLRHGIFASAALAYLAIKDGNKVSLATFSSFINEFVPFGKGKKHLYAIFNVLVNVKPCGGTDIEYSVWRILPRIKFRSLIMIITDMISELDSLKKAFKILALNGHKVIVFHIYDPEMYKLPEHADLITFKDPLTGKNITLNVKDPLFKATYYALVHAEKKKRKEFIKKCRATGIDILSIKTTELVEKAILKYLIAKKRGLLLK